MSWEEQEGAARALLEEIGLEDAIPVDSFEVAAMCGLRLRPWKRRGAALGPGRIDFNPGSRPTRVQGEVFHELGHFTARWSDLEDTEPCADYIGAALALPRRPFDRDLRATAWDLRVLQAKHINCSAELIARRIVCLRDAVATVFDRTSAGAWKTKVRVASPWLADERFARVSRFERELALHADATEEVQRADELIWAFPVIDGQWRRVVLVCEAEQLSMKF